MRTFLFAILFSLFTYTATQAQNSNIRPQMKAIFCIENPAEFDNFIRSMKFKRYLGGPVKEGYVSIYKNKNNDIMVVQRNNKTGAQCVIAGIKKARFYEDRIRSQGYTRNYTGQITEQYI